MSTCDSKVQILTPEERHGQSRWPEATQNAHTHTRTHTPSRPPRTAAAVGRIDVSASSEGSKARKLLEKDGDESDVCAHQASSKASRKASKEASKEASKANKASSKGGRRPPRPDFVILGASKCGTRCRSHRPKKYNYCCFTALLLLYCWVTSALPL